MADNSATASPLAMEPRQSVLSDVEVRILGCLVEKDLTTPDYYPLSLNALVNACNQKSNRDPVTNLDEDAVRQGVYALDEKRLLAASSSADSRVTKYEHRLQEMFNLGRPETAVLCVLLLRGPQTPGELRGRTERMHRFGELPEVQSALQRLLERQPPLVKMLARQPGTKEARYVHLLAGEKAEWQAPPEAATPALLSSVDSERLARLETELADLKKEFGQLQQQFAQFRRQFE